MKDQIKSKIQDTIKRFNASHNDQVNLASGSAQQDLADAIMRELLDCEVEIETYNEDQLELFSNIDPQQHK